jgi:hypothetical protein
MSRIPLPIQPLRGSGDGYGFGRMPRSARAVQPERIDRVAYGRFRNVYVYITEAWQLRCEHCYMGERLERALKMPLLTIIDTLTTWRRLGGSKVTILGGEPTLHPDYCASKGPHFLLPLPLSPLVHINMRFQYGVEGIARRRLRAVMKRRCKHDLLPGQCGFCGVAYDYVDRRSGEWSGARSLAGWVRTARSRESSARGKDSLQGRPAPSRPAAVSLFPGSRRHKGTRSWLASG